MPVKKCMLLLGVFVVLLVPLHPSGLSAGSDDCKCNNVMCWLVVTRKEEEQQLHSLEPNSHEIATSGPPVPSPSPALVAVSGSQAKAQVCFTGYGQQCLSERCCNWVEGLRPMKSAKPKPGISLTTFALTRMA